MLKKILKKQFNWEVLSVFQRYMVHCVISLGITCAEEKKVGQNGCLWCMMAVSHMWSIVWNKEGACELNQYRWIAVLQLAFIIVQFSQSSVVL